MANHLGRRLAELPGQPVESIAEILFELRVAAAHHADPTLYSATALAYPVLHVTAVVFGVIVSDWHISVAVM